LRLGDDLLLLVNLMRILVKLPIDKNLFVLPFDNIARGSDDSLEKILLGSSGYSKLQHPPLWVANLQDLGVSKGIFVP